MANLRLIDDGLPVQVDDDEDYFQDINRSLQMQNNPHHARAQYVHPRMNRPIQIGVSLMNTSVTDMLTNTSNWRACAVKVVNHTRWTLESAGIFIKGGHSISAQHNVEPLTAEAFVAEKTKGTATSSYGTASFSVQGQGRPRYINIMWSVPFDRNIFKNVLGIEVSQDCGPHDFDRMYYRRNFRQHSVTRDFKRNLVPLRVQTNDLAVVGSMGNGPKVEALINVYEH
ncbi:uncharacterized protein LOC119735282 [Patiria miniata]|uniref:Uncharacterized protein n=1 Tax=Patiria miniata TaxID=46514 RepID=A0A914AN99_PATMI|nr:uncharacterized protein LOC119735282 [Patiria miniata]